MGAGGLGERVYAEGRLVRQGNGRANRARLPSSARE